MNQRSFRVFGSVCLSLILSFACPAIGRGADAEAAAGAEYLNFGRRFESAIGRGDASTAAAMLNMDALLDRSTSGVSAPADFAAGFRGGVKKGFSLFPALAKATQQGGSYKLLRIRERQGRTEALFRMIAPGGGLNYHQWLFGTNAAGQLSFSDVYVATTGEMMSQTLRRTYVAGVASQDKTFLDRLLGRDKEMAVGVKAIEELTKELQAEQYQAMLDSYKTFPPDVQKDKNIMILRFAAATKLRESKPEEYRSVMADFEKMFPGDPCVDLVCIDGYMLEKNYKAAHQSLDHLAAFTGGDAYLDYMHAALYIQEGGDDNVVLAKQSEQRAIDAEPSFVDAYWTLVSLSMKEKDFDETTRRLDELRNNAHIRIKNLETIPAYAEYVKSDSYRKWKAAQGQAVPAQEAAPGQ